MLVDMVKNGIGGQYLEIAGTLAAKLLDILMQHSPVRGKFSCCREWSAISCR